MACELRSVAIPDVQAQGLILSDTDAASYRARPRARALGGGREFDLTNIGGFLQTDAQNFAN
jgi:hypothetical protein